MEINSSCHHRGGITSEKSLFSVDCDGIVVDVHYFETEWWFQTGKSIYGKGKRLKHVTSRTIHYAQSLIERGGSDAIELIDNKRKGAEKESNHMKVGRLKHY